MQRHALALSAAMIIAALVSCTDAGTPSAPAPKPGPATSATDAKSNGGASGTFTRTGSMNFVRFNHRAVLLKTGEVLVAGGVVGNSNETAVELYNPSTSGWTLTGSTSIVHDQGSLTLLANGQALLVGGFALNGTCTAIAELYDRSSGQWTSTGSMTTPRCAAAVVLLADGKVLATGGTTTSGSAISSAELYDPATRTWRATPNLTTSAAVTRAALLGNGTVLAVGNDFTAEIFNPAADSWSKTGSLAGSAFGPISTLSSGSALVVSNSFYTPATGIWSPTGPLPRTSLSPATTATLLANGEVLATGWRSLYSPDPPLSLAVLYNESLNSYSATGSMRDPRAMNTATRLASGQVLVAGGYNRTGPDGSAVYLSSAELYTP